MFAVITSKRQQVVDNTTFSYYIPYSYILFLPYNPPPNRDRNTSFSHKTTHFMYFKNKTTIIITCEKLHYC